MGSGSVAGWLNPSELGGERTRNEGGCWVATEACIQRSSTRNARHASASLPLVTSMRSSSGL